MKKLSNYTHAKYCTDMTDCIYGIDEINKAIKNRKIIIKLFHHTTIQEEASYILN